MNATSRHLAVVLAFGLSASRQGLAAETILTPTQLQTVPHVINNYSVSAADSTIAFDVTTSDGAENVWTVQRFATSGTPITALPFGAGDARNPLWVNQANQGGLLAYLQDEANTPGLTQIFIDGLGSQTPPDMFDIPTYSWSTDGTSLVFIEQAPSVQPFNSLAVVSIGGFGLTRIKGCSPQCESAQWSPTDNVIAYGLSQLGSFGGGIWLINPDGSGDHMILPPGSTGPVWSPNSGMNIAYGCNGGTDICVASSDGANPVNLTKGQLGLVYSSPNWSIDENFIGMVGRPSSSSPAGDLYIIPALGGAPVRVTNTGNVSNPQWSPIIGEIFYLCQHGANVDICVTPGPSSTPGPCNISTCNGCCVQNVCFPGTSAVQCGSGAAACATCPANQTCSSQTHTCVSTACNSSNCTGCCDATNVCQAGTGKAACGAGAARCETCVGNQVCSTSQRICVNTLCSASTCTGCCDAQGKCQAGTTNTACGANGLTCTQCTSSETCSTSHTCVTQGCDAVTCPTGCCDVNGHCQPGNSPTACGYSGFACVNCNGGTCDGNNHTCGAPTSCSSANCVGCCGAADNQCHGGGTNAFCGSNGFTCETCSTGQMCSFSAGFCE